MDATDYFGSEECVCERLRVEVSSRGLINVAPTLSLPPRNIQATLVTGTKACLAGSILFQSIHGSRSGLEVTILLQIVGSGRFLWNLRVTSSEPATNRRALKPYRLFGLIGVHRLTSEFSTVIDHQCRLEEVTCSGDAVFFKCHLFVACIVSVHGRRDYPEHW